MGTRQEIGLLVLFLLLTVLSRIPDLFTVATGTSAEETIIIEEKPLSGKHALLAGKLMDLNTASLEDLEVLPGIGPVLAERIVEKRHACDGFKDFEDLLTVRGIGRKRLAMLRTYVTIGGQTKTVAH